MIVLIQPSGCHTLINDSRKDCFENPSTLGRIMDKSRVSCFLTHGVYSWNMLQNWPQQCPNSAHTASEFAGPLQMMLCP